MRRWLGKGDAKGSQPPSTLWLSSPHIGGGCCLPVPQIGSPRGKGGCRGDIDELRLPSLVIEPLPV